MPQAIGARPDRRARRRRNTMRHVFSAIVLVGVLAAPSFGIASPAATKPASKTVATKSTKNTAATHSTVGIVKSMDANELVVTHKGKKPGDMTFTLDPST